MRQFARETPRPASEKRTAIGAAGAGRPSRRRCSGCPWPEPSCSEGKPLGEQAPGARAAGAATAVGRAARCPGAGHWSVAPSSHSVHRWPSMGRLSYRSPRALAPHCLVEADTCEQRARHAHSRRRRRRPMTPAAETNRRAASHRGAQPLEDLASSAAGRIAAARPQLLEGCGTRAQVLARPVCMARCGAEWGQCRRTKGERAREATPRVENVSVRRGLPSATRPPPTGSRVQVTGQCGRPRSARHRDRARLCPKTYVPRHGARRRASATAQNGASWASPAVEARACCQPERVASITNPSVFPGARARTCACAALVWGPRTCARAHVAASSLSNSVPARDPRIP